MDKTDLEKYNSQLREARKSDLADFHEFFSDRDVMRYWTCPTHTSIDRTEWYLNDMITSSTNGESEFVIVLPAAISLDPPSTVVSKDKVIGTVGIWDQTTGEIELMLHRDHWGQGYMKEALATLIPIFWGFPVVKTLRPGQQANCDHPSSRSNVEGLVQFSGECLLGHGSFHIDHRVPC